MKAVKKFDFPTFEEWNINNEWKQTIGDYTCSIATVGFGNIEIENKIAISKFDNPLNIWVPKLYRECITCNIKDNDKLKMWYNKVTKEANEEWGKYIEQTYFER